MGTGLGYGLAMKIPFTSVLIAAWMTCALSWGCGSKDGNAEAAKLGTFTCTDVKNDVCMGQTDRFKTTAPVVHMIHTDKNLPANGDVFEIAWIAEDVGEAAPANTVIRTTNHVAEDMVPEMVSYTITGSLTKPTNGWPIGKYRVEVKHDGKLVTTARFAIEQ